MRKRLLQTGCAALTTVLAVTLGGCNKGQPPAESEPPAAQVAAQPPAENVEPPTERGVVNVKVRCSPNQTFVSVEPWVLDLNVGESAEWRLVQSTADSLEVAPKHGQWPFSGTGPQHGNANTPARSGGPANAPGRHKYSITVVCGTAAQPGPTVIIDPDMDIH